MYPNLLTAVCASCTRGQFRTGREPNTGRNLSRIPPGQAYAVAGFAFHMGRMEHPDPGQDPQWTIPLICKVQLPAQLNNGLQLFFVPGIYENPYHFIGAPPTRCG